ncbi:MAG: UDP-galactopyranose mutase [Algoriphagus sp.]|jgi:UDP-galactopyranose mutase
MNAQETLSEGSFKGKAYSKDDYLGPYILDKVKFFGCLHTYFYYSLGQLIYRIGTFKFPLVSRGFFT